MPAMAVESNAGTTPRPGGATGEGFVPGQSGNPGGRPRGLARMVHEAVSDGADVVALMTAVLKGDRKGPGRQDSLAQGQDAGPPPGERVSET
jgi:hypothetical protein